MILDSGDSSLYDVHSTAPGPAGPMPITPEMLLRRPSGDLFGWSQNAGMGWDPAALGGKEFLILSTHGGIRAADGTPVAWATTPATGKSDCSWMQRPRS